MVFILSENALKYFAKLKKASTSGYFETTWDQYYICLMAGFRTGNLQSENDNKKGQSFAKNFIKDYIPQKYEIIATLILSEIRRKGIDLTDDITTRASVRTMMLELLDQSSATSLSTDGHKLMNEYAEGGFEEIHEIIYEPREFDLFLETYYQHFMKD